MHLPPDMASDYIHLPTWNGGLGVPAFTEIIPLSKAKQCVKLRESDDPACQAIVELDMWKTELRRNL